MMENGAEYAAPHHVDLIVSVGGGSSMDCAKGINFLALQWRQDAGLLGLWQSH